MTLSVSMTDGGRVAQVALEGEHDVSSAHELSRALLACCLEPVEVVVVDVALCTFADSTVLGALVSAYKRMTARGGALVLTHAHGALGKLLEITCLDDLLNAPEGFDPSAPLTTLR